MNNTIDIPSKATFHVFRTLSNLSYFRSIGCLYQIFCNIWQLPRKFSNVQRHQTLLVDYPRRSNVCLKRFYTTGKCRLLFETFKSVDIFTIQWFRFHFKYSSRQVNLQQFVWPFIELEYKLETKLNEIKGNSQQQTFLNEGP